MEKKHSSKAVVKSFFKYRRVYVLLGIGLASLIAYAIMLPLSIIHSNLWLLVVANAIILASIINTIVLILTLVHRYSKDSALFASEMSRQADSFLEGIVRTGKKDDPRFPLLSSLQEKLDKAINSYSDYEIVYVGKPKDLETYKEVKEGKVYEKEEFQKVVYNEIRKSASYRTAVLLVELRGKTTQDEDIASLVASLKETFPFAIMGQYDPKTVALCILNVESFLGLETIATRFVTNFTALKLDDRSGKERVIYSKIGGAIYPYVSLNNLFEVAEKALGSDEEVTIAHAISDIYYPNRILTQEAKRTLFLANFEKFEKEMNEAKSYADQIETIKHALMYLASSNMFEVAGIYEYNATANDYRNLFEESRVEGKAGFKRFGDTLPASFFSSYVNEAKRDVLFLGNASSDFPTNMAEPLASLGMESFYIGHIGDATHDFGFVYLLSSEKRSGASANTKEDFLAGISFISNTLMGIVLAHHKKSNDGLMDALADRSNRYLYSVDRPSMTITYLSDNLKRAFPNAKIGDICYKSLRKNHNEVCSRCPLRFGSDRRIIGEIAPTESQLSILQYRGGNDDESTIMIEPVSNQGLVAGSHLVDDALLIRNNQALAVEVNRELKNNKRGYIVTFKVIDHEKAIRALPQSDANSIMSNIVVNFQDAGYGDLIYRFDTFSIAFLLKAYNKTKMIDFVEEAAELLSHPLEARDKFYTPSFAYSAVAYPSEIVTSKQMASTIKEELLRSEKDFGPGYLVEVANRHPRKALRNEYIYDILKSTLDEDALPVLTQPIVDGDTFKVLGGDIRAALYGRDKLPIAPREFIPIANKEGLVSRVDIAALSMMGQLFSNYGYGIFQTIGLKYLSMYLSTDSLGSESFPEEVKNIINRFQLPPEYIHLEINSSFFVDNQEEVRRCIDELSPTGVVFEAVDHTPEKAPLETIKKFGVRIIKTERSLIWNAASNENDLGNFSRFLDAAIRNDFDVVVTGIENVEQRDLASSLGAAALEGYFFGTPMKEEDFIKTLNYGQKKND
ncbi:MAG: EAL domain-containing protein [Bacilli bacterium]|nr:EAL domain-containing protein [Bacilli bacterium]